MLSHITCIFAALTAVSPVPTDGTIRSVVSPYHVPSLLWWTMLPSQGTTYGLEPVGCLRRLLIPLLNLWSPTANVSILESTPKGCADVSKCHGEIGFWIKGTEFWLNYAPGDDGGSGTRSIVFDEKEQTLD